jgi:hypothetical protein
MFGYRREVRYGRSGPIGGIFIHVYVAGLNACDGRLGGGLIFSGIMRFLKTTPPNCQARVSWRLELLAIKLSSVLSY